MKKAKILWVRFLAFKTFFSAIFSSWCQQRLDSKPLTLDCELIVCPLCYLLALKCKNFGRCWVRYNVAQQKCDKINKKLKYSGFDSQLDKLFFSLPISPRAKHQQDLNTLYHRISS
jgi:hypothetical protein